jgi:hypothetical protein
LRPSYNVGVPFDDAADNKDYYAAQAIYFGNGMALVDSSTYYSHLPLFAFDDATFDGKRHFFSMDVPKRLNQSRHHALQPVKGLVQSLVEHHPERVHCSRRSAGRRAHRSSGAGACSVFSGAMQ